MTKKRSVLLTLFSSDVPVSNKGISNYLKDISLRNDSVEKREVCEGELTEKR